MLTVEIHENQVTCNERSGISPRTQKAYTIREQSGYVDLGGTYPVPFKFNLEEGQHPYPAGKYRIHVSSYFISKYGQISIGRILLESLKS